MEGHILFVDDDDDILAAGELLLKSQYKRISTCSNPIDIPKLLANDKFDVILLDMNFAPGDASGTQGYFWLEKILEIDPDAVVIFITAHYDIDIAVEAMKKGATDFITKPWQNEKLLATVATCVKLKKSKNEAERLKQTNQALNKIISTSSHPIIGKSDAMKAVHNIVNRCAATDANVLLLGENGTGKELIAREIHQHSLRANNVYMSVDLGTLSENIFESELFGHKRGAFTDAKKDREGRFEAAEGGTLFLDEIGNLPLHLQTKLLTALEQKKVTPVGSQQPIPFDVRIIAATNLPMDKLRDETYFRKDLLYRLNTVEILLPPLRERHEDIEDISNYYLSVYAHKYNKPIKSISTTTIEHLCHYSWPGNIRELKHAIERAVILSDTDSIDFSSFILSNNQLEKTNTADYQTLNLDLIEKTTIEKALKQHRYNISHTAKTLGLTRAALYRRMEKHDL